MDSWKRVGDAIKDRRLELGWTQQEGAERADVSLATWRLIEVGGRERYQDLTIRGISRALGWPADAIPRLLDGGPAPRAGTPGESPSITPTDDNGGVPMGFARKYQDLTDQERAKVEGFVDGLFASRPS